MRREPTTETIARYTVEETFDRLPADVIDQSKRCLLDCLGCMLGGVSTTRGRTVRDLYAEEDGVGEATVASGTTMPVGSAAYVNGFLANVLDFDDTTTSPVGHPGATIVPAALAVAERANADVQALLESILVGYEVAIHVGDAISPSAERARNVTGFSTWQVFGATAAAAKLLGLEATAVRNALGLAGTVAPVPAMRKSYEDGRIQTIKSDPGWAARGGVKSALLAERGFHGNEAIFDGDNGFWKMAASDQFDPECIASLGDEYRIDEVSFKPYPSCRWTHAALDCCERLSDHVEDASAVKSVAVETFADAGSLSEYPATPLDAQFSLPFTVAARLVTDRPRHAPFTQEQIDDPDVRSVAEQVSITVDEERTRRYEASGQVSARLRLRTRDGEYESETPHAPGTARNPLTPEELAGKFIALATETMAESDVREMQTAIESASDSRPVSDLTTLLG